MRILIYKPTHTGDPYASGCFGLYDCMGSVRGLNFDAVIGIGGIRSEAHRAGIAGRITWIGIGAHRAITHGRGPLITFDQFVLFDGKGKELRDIAPSHAKRPLTPLSSLFTPSSGNVKACVHPIDRFSDEGLPQHVAM